jgi:hypothetical protein
MIIQIANWECSAPRISPKVRSQSGQRFEVLDKEIAILHLFTWMYALVGQVFLKPPITNQVYLRPSSICVFLLRETEQTIGLSQAVERWG